MPFQHSAVALSANRGFIVACAPFRTELNLRFNCIAQTMPLEGVKFNISTVNDSQRVGEMLSQFDMGEMVDGFRARVFVY